MPLLSRLMIKTALFHLMLGFSLGGLLLANKGIPLYPTLWLLLPAHQEFQLTGCMFHLTLGVAFWILPRFSQEPRRGNIHLAWAGWIFLNLGIWAISLSPVAPGWEWLPFIGRLLQPSGGLAFGLHAWRGLKQRVHEYNAHKSINTSRFCPA